jgi:hypothetical protein
MIIFYDKSTGNITGTVDGRIHPEDHLKMWVGDKDTTDRIIVSWKPVKFYNKNGKVTKKVADRFTADFEPDTTQKELFMDIDKDRTLLKKYRVDTKNGNLIPL